jgi:hypothetical protein
MSHRRRGLVAIIFTLAVVSSASPPLAAQQAYRTVQLPTAFAQGFVTALSGEVIIYPWAYPGQVGTLLSRATDGQMAVEWEGERLSSGPGDEAVTYLWHAGTASGYGAHRFMLFVNDRLCATFTSGQTTTDREWVAQGDGPVSLSFKTARVGTFNERLRVFGLSVKRPTTRTTTSDPRSRCGRGFACDPRMRCWLAASGRYGSKSAGSVRRPPSP